MPRVLGVLGVLGVFPGRDNSSLENFFQVKQSHGRDSSVSGDGDIYPLTHVAIVLRTLRQIVQIVMTVMAFAQVFLCWSHSCR